MSSRYERPPLVRRLNAMAMAVGGSQHVVPIDADDLLTRATDALGLSNFEIGDGDWETRFRRLVDAINLSSLHVVGRLMTREELLRCLRTRLLLAEQRRQTPAIADEAIVAPIVVTGPARSGTTILFELLAQDTNLRAPIASDVLFPVLATDADPADRQAMTEVEQELWADVQPEFAAIHELRSDLPVECITIGAPSFGGSHWAMILGTMGDWVPDPAADLRFHKAVLQSVQHNRRPATWILKTPGYLMMMDELLAAYPDARIIQTHRDPAKTMPSTVSTTAMVQWLRTDAVDLDGLSALIGAIFTDALANSARRRRAGTWSARFGDARFADLMSDPVGAIRAAYDQLGQPFTDEHATAISRYLAAKPRGQHGTHHYTAAQWGFDPAQLRRDLAEYMDYFGVVVEP